MGDPSFRKVPNTYFVKMLIFWKNQAKISVSVMTFHPKIFHPTTMCYFDDFGLTLKIKELGHEKLTFWVTNNLATLNLAIFG